MEEAHLRGRAEGAQARRGGLARGRTVAEVALHPDHPGSPPGPPPSTVPFTNGGGSI